MSCFAWLVLLSGGIFLVLSFIRWCELTTEAVDHGLWDRVILLLVMPFAVWFFRSSVVAGRPTAVPLHEPVRGFGGPKSRAAPAAAPSDQPPVASAAEPPPGTPKEFLEKPKIPPPMAKRARSSVDPELLAKLKQKMREQGMLKDEDDKPDAE